MLVAPETVINIIRENLNDRYRRGFPIVKELIQNADDAQASSIDLGVSPGLPGASHPLLQGPALFVLNDGSFTSDNARAIRSIATSSKPADETAIGKFGLGLKSVFHFAEAFFYWGDEYTDLKLVNPWVITVREGDPEYDKIHPTWSQDTRVDSDLLSTYLRRQIRPQLRFGLWIPLRRRSHLGSVAAITDYYPGEERQAWLNLLTAGEMSNSELAHQVASLMPMLSHVQTVRYWLLGEEGMARRIYEVALQSDSARRSAVLTPGSSEWFNGVVRVNIENMTTRSLLFVGRAKDVTTPAFERLKVSPYWPQHKVTDSQTFALRAVPDKAAPHAAVCFAARPAQQSTAYLQVDKAVFLPVGEPDRISLGDSKNDIVLTLHGYFFVDAGRLRVEGLEACDNLQSLIDSRTLRQAWNSQIYQHGTLPLVLPALDDFVRRVKMADADLKELVRALSLSDIYRERTLRAAVCRESQWVYMVAPGQRRWRLLPSTSPMREIPEPPESDLERPFRVLPRLAKFTDLTYAGYPRLSGETQTQAWSPTDLTDLLQCDASIFGSKVQLGYLNRFLDQVSPATLQHTAVIDRLRTLVQRASGQVEPADLRANQQLLRDFCARLPAEMCFAIKLASEVGQPQRAAVDAILRHLARTESAVLLLPPSLLSDTTGTLSSVMSVKDAEPFLRALASENWQEQGDAFADAATTIACQIFRFVQDKHTLRAQCADLALFGGQQVSATADIPLRLSWRDIDRLREQRLLFKNLNPPSPYGLARPLAGALQSGWVTLVRSEVLTSLGYEEIGGCDENRTIQILLKQPALAENDRRLPLFVELLKNRRFSTPDGQRALRYLLHGDAIHMESQDPLMVAGESDDFWSQLLQAALEVRPKERWRMVAPEYAQVLAPDARIALRLQIVGSAGVLALLEEYTSEELAALDVQPIGRLELLQRIDNPRLLASLPIHLAATGEHTTLREGRTYVATGYAVPPGLLRDSLVLSAETEEEQKCYREKLKLPLLDATAVASIILTQPQPFTWWRELLEACANLRTAPAEDLRRRLQNTAWLPLHDANTPVKPCDVIDIPGMENELARLLVVTKGEFADVLRLEPTLRQQPGWSKVRRWLLPGNEDAVSILSTVLENDPGYCVGDMEGCDSALGDAEERLPQFLALWRDAGDSLMPAAPVLSQIAQHVSPSAAANLWRQLGRPIPSARLSRILDYLAGLHAKAAASQQPELLAWFNHYLGALKRQPSLAADLLPHMQLLNQRGSWRPAGQLCFGYEGIDRSDLLDTGQAHILGLNDLSVAAAGRKEEEAAVSIPSHVADQDFVTAAHALADYFREWETVIDGEIAGGLLCLLGDHPAMQQLAGRMLGRRHLQETRDLLEWTPLQGVIAGVSVGGAGQTMNQVMNYQRFLVEIVHNAAQQQQVIALTGQPFMARLLDEAEMDTILVQDGHRCGPQMRGSLQVNLLRLRWIDVRHFSEQQLARLLGNTAQFVLSRIYAQKPRNFATFWEDLQNSEQLDIESAQEWLLRSIPHYLPQLGLRSDPDLSPLLKQWQEASMRDIEAKRRAHVRGTLNNTPAADVTSTLYARLRTMLENNDPGSQAIQRRILAAMRHKIGNEYQYRPEGVVFELFQNADDALLELRPAWDASAPDSDLYTTVVLELRPDALVFAHWGRAINQSRVGSFDGAQVGYDLDLPKMLSLQDSDKTANRQPTPLTGKFGLGFKSVYLITDQPEILSGRLAFDITGGIYPRRIIERRQVLEELRSSYTGGRQKRATGTIFYLPHESGIMGDNCPARRAFAAFAEFAHFIVIFAKQIRHCTLRRPGWADTHVSWLPQPVAGCPNLTAGSAQPLGQHGNKPLRVLLCHDTTSSVVLALTARGFERLPAQAPTIWVTAPTLEKQAAGFLVNAPFDLDVGRAQLARSSQANARLAQQIGHMLASALTQLTNLAQDWPALCGSLGLAVDTSPYTFWDSLWSTLVDTLPPGDDSEAATLLRTMIMGKDCGLHRLITDYTVIPTRLPGKFQTLAVLPNVRYAASALLEQVDILDDVLQWPQAHKRLVAGSLISRQVLAALTRSQVDTSGIDVLTLRSLVHWETGGSLQVEPALASLLGALIDQSFVSKQQSEHPVEIEELLELLRRLEFRSAAGGFGVARELMLNPTLPSTGSDESDELRRAAFAPARVQLDAAYDRTAIAFFRVCRGRLAAGVDVLVKWALDARQEETQCAVLRYCLEGELGRELAARLRSHDRFANSWLALLDTDDPRLAHVNEWSRPHLLHLLGLTVTEGLTILSPEQHLQVGPTLHNIYEWWRREKANLLPEYERLTYPGGQPPDASLFVNAADPEQRYAWLTLFVLGATHTVGRMQPEAHRNFLQRCQERGWFATFVNHAAGADEWMRVLDEYLDDPELATQELQYWHLIGKQFVSIYQLSRFLREYVEAFLYLGRVKSHVELHQVLKLRTSELFQGTGLDAPPITRTLGLGACFVVRELARFGVLRPIHVHSHCFTPVQRVRDRFAQLGCDLGEKPSYEQSAAMYDYACKHLGPDAATFDHCFDIPFQMIHRQWGSIPPHLCVYQ